VKRQKKEREKLNVEEREDRCGRETERKIKKRLKKEGEKYKLKRNNTRQMNKNQRKVTSMEDREKQS
jgi:hypothetical protein